MNTDMDFAYVYREYYRKILNYIHKRISSYQDAEDLTQEILTVCYRNWEKYDADRASVGTWVFVIANSRLKNYYRDKKQTDFLDEDPDLAYAEEDFLEKSILFQENKKMLYASLNALEETDRQIVVLKYFYGKTSDELAGLLGITPGNVRVRLYRALDKMRGYFKTHGYMDVT